MEGSEKMNYKKNYEYMVLVSGQDKEFTLVTGLDPTTGSVFCENEKWPLKFEKNDAEEIVEGLLLNGEKAALVMVHSSVPMSNHEREEKEDGPVFPDEVTGVIGAWLERGFEGLPMKAYEALETAYKHACEGGET